MKVLLDHQLAGVAYLLRNLGRDVITASDIDMEKSKDDELIDYAQKNNCVFVTENNDAANLAKLRRVEFIHLDVVLKAKAIDLELKNKDERDVIR